MKNKIDQKLYTHVTKKEKAYVKKLSEFFGCSQSEFMRNLLVTFSVLENDGVDVKQFYQSLIDYREEKSLPLPKSFVKNQRIDESVQNLISQRAWIDNNLGQIATALNKADASSSESLEVLLALNSASESLARLSAYYVEGKTKRIAPTQIVEGLRYAGKQINDIAYDVNKKMKTAGEVDIEILSARIEAPSQMLNDMADLVDKGGV